MTTPAPDEVAAALQLSIRMLLGRLRQLADPDDLSLPESAALKRLERDGPTTAANLARGERISPQSMGATVGALERRGLLERTRDPDDGRRVVLAITSTGSDVLRDDRGARTAWLSGALSAGFTPAELDQLLAASALIERLAGEV